MNTLEDLKQSYRKYKWFLTSSGKLVLGGKSATQNDELLHKVTKSGKELVVMHTSHPGSPFTVILADANKLSKKDLHECAVFTGSFSRAWKQHKQKIDVHIFLSSQLYKNKEMAVGTWGVSPKVEKMDITLELVLTKQKGILRAVPRESVKSKSQLLLVVSPGKVDKQDLLPKLSMALKDAFSQEEILSALPAGGVKILKV